MRAAWRFCAFACSPPVCRCQPSHRRCPGGAPRRSGRRETWRTARSYDADGNPTFKIEPDGTVDWYIYSGYRRYHADCHVCHGPDGEGSSYAPALVDSVKRIRLRRRSSASWRAGGRTSDAGQPERHAGVRHQPERHVLRRRHLHLSARPRAGRPAARPPGQARRQAAGGGGGGNRVHGHADPPRARRCGGARGIGGACRPAGARAGADIGLGAAIELVDPKVFRVCADPNSMPFSNEAEEGYEKARRAAGGASSGRPSPTPTSRRSTGFVRMTLGANKCDVIMSYPQGDELVQNTNAYYQTAYALVVQAGLRARRGRIACRSAAEGASGSASSPARRRPPTWR